MSVYFGIENPLYFFCILHYIFIHSHLVYIIRPTPLPSITLSSPFLQHLRDLLHCPPSLPLSPSSSTYETYSTALHDSLFPLPPAPRRPTPLPSITPSSPFLQHLGDLLHCPPSLPLPPSSSTEETYFTALHYPLSLPLPSITPSSPFLQHLGDLLHCPP